MITGVSLSGIDATLVVPQRMGEGYHDYSDDSARLTGLATSAQLIAPVARLRPG